MYTSEIVSVWKEELVYRPVTTFVCTFVRGSVTCARACTLAVLHTGVLDICCTTDAAAARKAAWRGMVKTGSNKQHKGKWRALGCFLQMLGPDEGLY